MVINMYYYSGDAVHITGLYPVKVGIFQRHELWPTRSDSATFDWRSSGVDPVLGRRDSNRLSTASSRLDRLWDHRATIACSSNCKQWLKKNIYIYIYHCLSFISTYSRCRSWPSFAERAKSYVWNNSKLLLLITNTQYFDWFFVDFGHLWVIITFCQHRLTAVESHSCNLHIWTKQRINFTLEIDALNKMIDSK